MFYAANGHNAIGRFYETFGNGGADTKERTVRAQSERAWFRPNPPLPRVKWSIRNNINLQQSALLLAMKFVADDKDRFLNNFYLKSRRSIDKPMNEGPAAYVIPGEEPRTGGISDLMAALQIQGIEAHRTTGPVKVKEGSFPSGSYVVRLDQPYSRLADMLLDTQWYNVNDPRPYDDTGWTLGPLHDVKTVRVTDTSILKAPMAMLPAGWRAPGALTGAGDVFVVDNRAEGQLAALRYRLRDASFATAEEGFEAAGRKFTAGALVLSGADRAAVEQVVKDLSLSALALDSAPKVQTHKMGLPRVALVHDWLNTQNEGWWRIAFDRYGVPYDYVSVHVPRDAPDLRARWDVIVIPPTGGASVPRQIAGIQAADAVPWMPSDKYPNFGGPDKTDDMRGGIGFEGLAHLRRFVEEGGVIVAAAGSALLPVRTGMVEAVDVSEPRGLQARGSVLRASIVDRASPIAYGYGETLAVYFNQAPVFEAGPAVALGGAARFAEIFGSPTPGRVSGRGGPKDADIPQGRPYVAPPEAPKGPPQSMADIPEEILDFIRNQLPPEDRLPRVVARFAKKDDLWVSGMLDKGEELAEKPAVIDCPVGKGHVVLFANNPMWRWQTHGSHALVFNTILNWDHLDAGRPAAKQTAGRP
jgi:hypothetical protein